MKCKYGHDGGQFTCATHGTRAPVGAVLSHLCEIEERKRRVRR